MCTKESDTTNVSDKVVQHDEDDEEECDERAMDKLLFIIKDKLPKEVVAKIFDGVANIRGIKSVTDIKAFLIIEFESKVDANAAKARGFEYVHNGQNQTIRYVNSSLTSLYMAEVCDGLGTGY